MKIAQIAPLMESVPPQLYGGTERIVSYLTEELVSQGHDVTLFASGDSITNATLFPCCKQALRLNPNVRDPIPYYMGMLDQVKQMALAGSFDVLHFHIDQFHFPIFNREEIPTLTTLHGRQDLPDLSFLYNAFPLMPLVSISESQRIPIKRSNFVGTVLHGLPSLLQKPTHTKADRNYLAFLGRISPEKRVDRAIEIAVRAGIPIKIAAKIDRADEAYFREIKPLLDQPGVEFIGEINEATKEQFLGDALALLFPIDWPEPFGLVMIEAMACGTPILAFNKGSVAEVIDENITGAIVHSVTEAVAALPRVLALDRTIIRRTFEERFSVRRMAQEYVAIYKTLSAAEAQNGTLQFNKHAQDHESPLRAGPAAHEVAL